MAAAPVLSPTFEKLTVVEAINKLHVDTHTDLTNSEADSRLQKYGPNAIEEEKTNPWRMFLGYFWSPMPWMIEAAAVMALLVRDWADVAIIVGSLTPFSAFRTSTRQRMHSMR